jgi:hypothetical protein
MSRAIIGFDRKIEREWLDALLDRLTAGASADDLRAFLRSLLKVDRFGQTALRKTITVLMRIWFFIPADHRAVWDEAIALLPTIPAQDRIWLHWGMTLLAYPAFRDAAAAIGRLLKLHGDFTLLQLQRRLIEIWGDRSTLKRASQRIVRSMVQWGVLAETDVRGRFVSAPKLRTASRPLQLWLLETSHLAGVTREVETRQLLSLPTSFPFEVDVGVADLRRSRRFEIHRQGLDTDMVSVSDGSGRAR